MFITKNQVRMHDTDMAGILYFPRQFRFVHEALEDWMASEGTDFQTLFHERDFVFVIVHAESDYIKSLVVGDKLEVRLSVEQIGTSSFTLAYEIYKADGTLAGKAKTVHVTLTSKTREKIPIPAVLMHILKKQFRPQNP